MAEILPSNTWLKYCQYGAKLYPINQCIKNVFYNDTSIIKFVDIDDCQPEPCKNNGTCVDLVNAYACICVTGYNDTNCTNGMI